MSIEDKLKRIDIAVCVTESAHKISMAFCITTEQKRIVEKMHKADIQLLDGLYESLIIQYLTENLKPI